MKIGIDCGHTLSGADYGAVGIKAESNLTREVGTKVISKLQALGHTVVKCYKDSCSGLNDSLSYRTNTANNNNVDLYVSIHFNCYNGSAYGTEVFTYGGKELLEARRVLNNICALGYTNRGLKDGSGLYVLKHTKAKAMLIECCFCDNAGDMNRYNAENMANAIVKGLVGTTVATPNKPKEVVKVQKPKYDETIPTGESIFKIPGTTGYIEQATDGRLIIHKDRGNYIAIGQGFTDLYWNDNKGNGGNKRLTD
ncbi:N-acetylmuramoyl-L-alanine amidase [Clostridium botulinum]|uniref:N-acetylmuramoyl-L-alanine amidase n=1 Tax=Clostridium botulinum TaxID=1491 RepID=UPI0013F0676D|nr:N-acetylmuramoyl-L-alanine amidase [Clostridium botulinum]MBY6898024.1 N-acetylmuramoyl-L-alanine amidase [Clostridium botulinum]MBY6912337.1 N-acetylmuramoyl-L-alanine amidase [Clostridium botulinum]MCR1176393.1 N-acetylmuramoyl-L-alanine amidase [Clostridium botulinum]NEZ80643.1 N-acetylmuramoyl-L-alanine amidase [Clostridium botulinum]NFA18169.1 N-acetylmuramoyl-L-alanine amidase [Clostridium botulinum]